MNAASTIGATVGLSCFDALVISLSALFSTASAINAALFSAGYFAKGMLSDDLLPDRVGGSSDGGVPTRTIILLAVVTVAFAAYGRLSAITAFASLAFIVVFGTVVAITFSRRSADRLTPLWPAIGAAAAPFFFVLTFYPLHR